MQVAGVDGCNRLARKGLRRLLSLPQAGVVEGNIQVALDAGVHVPGGFAVADGNDAGGVHAVA